MPANRAAHDPECYLCPGNCRANNKVNPEYRGPFVFDNDFPALSGDSPGETHEHPLFVSRIETGRCRVICYSERHDANLATMPVAEIATAIEAMAAEFRKLDTDPDINYVQIFENRGEMMGCSNQHPHAQIWATENLPNEPEKELVTQKSWLEQNGTCLLADYLASELEDGERLVVTGDHFVALVPYWATWPFETLVLPRDSVNAPDQLNGDQIHSLASLWKTLFTGYNELFGIDMPYSMGFHPRPSDGRKHPEWQLHCHIYPPLLRSSGIRKHMVGFEMLAMPQRDLTPEKAAEKLRRAIKS